MSDADYRKIIGDGLWRNNPALVQVLGLCPLLAVSGTFVNALALGMATVFVLTCSNLAVSLIRNHTSDTVRLPTFVMIIASVTTCAEFLMNAFTYEMYLILGIFIPLIVTNCTVLGRADAFASRNGLLPAVVDGLMMGLGFASVLMVLGALREIIGTGAIFSNMHLIFGEVARDWKWVLFTDYKPVLVAILPPGAFLFMGLLIALKNAINRHLDALAKAKALETGQAHRRVRTTGQIS
jgi:electron transport complex protein RnfE